VNSNSSTSIPTLLSREATLTDEDRFFERQRQNWTNLRRLGVRAANCTECTETDPRCFIGDLSQATRDGDTLQTVCERCKRKLASPKDTEAVDAKWSALRKAGVRNDQCYCGEDNPFCLEADHVDGRRSSSRVIGCCINCHLKRTSRQLTEYPSDSVNPNSELIVARNRLRGTIEHLELIAEGLRPIEKMLHDMSASEFDSYGNGPNAEGRSEDGTKT